MWGRCDYRAVVLAQWPASNECNEVGDERQAISRKTENAEDEEQDGKSQPVPILVIEVMMWSKEKEREGGQEFINSGHSAPVPPTFPGADRPETRFTTVTAS